MHPNVEYINHCIFNLKEQTMNTADFEHKLNGTTPMPKCNDLYILLGAVKGKEYSCPKCGKQEDDYDMSEGYNVDGENYPKCYNESKGGTIDGNYWDWDEVHVCSECNTKYWFRNGAY